MTPVSMDSVPSVPQESEGWPRRAVELLRLYSKEKPRESQLLQLNWSILVAVTRLAVCFLNV